MTTEELTSYNKGFDDAWNKMREILLPMDLLTKEEFDQLKAFDSRITAVSFICGKADFQKSKFYNTGIREIEATEYYEMYKDKEWNTN